MKEGADTMGHLKTGHRRRVTGHPLARLGQAEAAVQVAEAEERRRRCQALGIRADVTDRELERADLRAIAHAVFRYERAHGAVTPLFDMAVMSADEADALTEAHVAGYGKGYLVSAGLAPKEYDPDEWAEVRTGGNHEAESHRHEAGEGRTGRTGAG